MSWKGKQVFVTGADGFIGSHLAEALVQEGAAVTALAQYNSFDSHGWLDDLSGDVRSAINAVRGDVRDAHQMRSLCQGKDVILHLAALISIPYSYAAPSSYIDTNVSGTANVLQAALEGGANRVIQTSTSEVYGTAQTMPISEDHPLQGQSPYSASKIAADMMAEAFARSFELPVVTLRPFNTFGPRQSERAIIASLIRQVLDPNCKEIRVGNLSPSRAFSFVSDTVAAFLAAAEMNVKNNNYGRAFNAGTDRMVSIGTLLKIILTSAESKKPVVQEKIRFRPEDSEIMALIADSSALHAASGWSPAVTLEDGISRCIDWWRGRIDQVRPEQSYIV
jgi:NAD dependent epimerase/dehydratase